VDLSHLDDHATRSRGVLRNRETLLLTALVSAFGDTVAVGSGFECAPSGQFCQTQAIQ